MNYPKTKRTLMSLAVAGTFTSIVVPGYAQDAAATAQTDTTAGAVNTPEANAATVVVSGIRRSLQSSMNLKRKSDGIVDGIVAEDIGKFPDTNLAESLQRISGVSIDRSNGEGSKVTVRGIGPNFNLVLLNGRQMPTSNFDGLQAPVSRSFDFANLASEAISQIQVYKSARADTPTGGVGAVLNVMTARPLDNPGLHASVGIKGVYDTSNNNLPADIKAGGKTLTPEYSGIFSDTFHDKMFGVALSASYQERNSGNSVANVDWLTNKGYTGGWGSVPTPTDAGYDRQTNRPASNAVYATPLSIGYSVNGVQRKRTNGQAVFQFAPTKDLTTTLDYTYAQNKVTTRTAGLGAWMAAGGNTAAEWYDGTIVSPKSYSEAYTSPGDITTSGSYTKTKTQLGSVGFNAKWRATDKLKLELDTHHSVSETKPDSPYGFNNSLGVSSYARMGNRIDFTGDMPVLTLNGEDFAAFPPAVSGSSFRNALQRMEVNQTQAKGSLDILESSSLDFGLAVTNVKNRSAYVDNQNGAWGAPGASANTSYAANTWHYDDLKNYFDQFNYSGNPEFSSKFVTFDFDNVIKQISDAAHTNRPDLYRMNDFTAPGAVDRRTEEKSKSLYGQVRTDWDTALPLHTAIGLRYEKTDVTSTGLVAISNGIVWTAPNEYTVSQSGTTNTTFTGNYSYLLPNIDTAVDLDKDTKLRASYSESIGRPGWDEIQGGESLDALARVTSGSGNVGNPALKPVRSKNIDLSYEWYYGKQSYLSVGFFRKNLRDYTGISHVTKTAPYNLHTPAGGALWNDAINIGNCPADDSGCIYNWIIANRASSPGVDAANGRITGQPGDPILPFDITTRVNKEAAGISGVELNVQHMFGNTGFGVAANYTYVKSDLKYDNASLADQFVLLGLSNSSNLVGIYEDSKWSIRAAYNWRGQFYNGTGGQGGTPKYPIYTDAYGQLDLSVGYNITSQLSLQFEGINLKNATQRHHSRDDQEVLDVTQGGPRYSLGMRYKF